MKNAYTLIHEVMLLPHDLIDLMYRYVPLDELIKLSLSSLPQLPPTRPWKSLLKYYPNAYAQFTSGHITQVFGDEGRIMIMAGLYTPKFSRPLTQYKAIVHDQNFKLYLTLTYYNYSALTIQEIYDTVQVYMRAHTYRDSQRFLVNLGAGLNIENLVKLTFITENISLQRKLLKQGVETYGPVLLKSHSLFYWDVEYTARSIYEHLIYHFPDLALTNIDLVPIAWADFNGFSFGTVGGKRPLPNFDYAKLIQAYYDRIGPIDNQYLMSLERVPNALIKLMEPYMDTTKNVE